MNKSTLMLLTLLGLGIGMSAGKIAEYSNKATGPVSSSITSEKSLKLDEKVGIYLVHMEPYWMSRMTPDEIRNDSETQLRLLEIAEKNGNPVYVFNTWKKTDSTYLSESDEIVNAVDESLSNLNNRLESMANVYCAGEVKGDDSLVINDLNQKGINTVIGTGGFTEACLKQWLYGARKNGFSAVSSRDLAFDIDVGGQKNHVETDELYSIFGLLYENNLEECIDAANFLSNEKKYN